MLFPLEIENSEIFSIDNCESTSKNLIESTLSSKISILNGFE